MVDGIARSSVDEDVVSAAVIERHGRHGGVGKGFLAGFGLERGAIAETVSHNSHNIIVMGVELEDMVVAANAVIKMQGGVVLVEDGEVIDSLRLPVAGLINDELDAVEMTATVARLTRIAQERLGKGPRAVHAPRLSLVDHQPDLEAERPRPPDVDSLSILEAVVEPAATEVCRRMATGKKGSSARRRRGARANLAADRSHPGDPPRNAAMAGSPVAVHDDQPDPRGVPGAVGDLVGFEAHNWLLSEHTGTHTDAIVEYEPGGASLEDTPLEYYYGCRRSVSMSATSAIRTG